MAQAFWLIILTFIGCEMGQIMTNTFAEIDHEIGQWDWYLYPIEIQRVLQIIIPSLQRPVVLQGFGSITYSRITFNKVSFMKNSLQIH